MKRRDLFSECAQPGTPIDVLKTEWCSRCGNAECVRSSVGLSKFEDRIKDWESKLFLAPPQLSPDDPRFARIQALKFITLDVGRTPEIRSDWTDPRDLVEPEPKPEPAAPPLIIAPPEPVLVIPQQEPQARTPSPSKPTASPASSRVLLVGANAADQSGKTLPAALGSSTTVPTGNAADPWAVPEPPQPTNEVVVKPGAKIRMGGGSGV